MRDFVAVGDASELSGLEGSGPVSPIGADLLALHAPSAHWLLVEGHRLLARCSLWWDDVPALPGERLGVIGHYAAQDETTGRALLEHAARQLSAHRCTRAVGPMDGNTWRSYRLVVERGTELAFFLEPDNPDDWPSHFTGSGFSILATYTSALATDLAQEDPRLDAVAARLETDRVRIRTLDVATPDRDLEQIYDVSTVSFARNYLYTPIPRAEFETQYRAVLSHVQPELVLLAEQEGRAVGFLFAIPDLYRARQGQPVDTVIIKTVAVLPGRAGAGLGSLLVNRCHHRTLELGYARAIHALMHESNSSRSISGRYARTIRRYALFSRPLA